MLVNKEHFAVETVGWRLAEHRSKRNNLRKSRRPFDLRTVRWPSVLVADNRVLQVTKIIFTVAS